MFLGFFFFSFFLMDLLAGTFDYRKPQNFINDWFNGLPAVGEGIPHCLYHVFKDVFVESWGLFCNEEKYLITKFSLSYCLVHQFSIKETKTWNFFPRLCGKNNFGVKILFSGTMEKRQYNTTKFHLTQVCPNLPFGAK